MQKYGYVRVSSRTQNEARQLDALENYAIPAKNLYVEKCSGKDFDRPQYRKLIRKLRQGDLLIIKSIDRLGRNYDEILVQWRRITKEIGADILVVDMPLLDTRQGRDLTGILIADIVLQLLSYVAQTEREFIRMRQAEGIAAAKARGVRFGPKPLVPPAGYEACLKEWRCGKLSARAAAKQLGVSHKTFLKWARTKEETTVNV